MQKYILIDLDFVEDTPMGQVPKILAICDTKEELFVELIETLIAFGYEEDRELMSCNSYDELVPIVESDDDLRLKVWKWESN